MIRCYLGLVFCLTQVSWAAQAQREADFNFGWRFSLQEQAAHAPDYDDTAWRTLRLPHDWSVEASFDPNLEGCTGYLPGGMGWYRKHFTVDVNEDQVTYLCFDGVYNRSELWLNGTKLGFQPYGYSPFYFDITSHLRADQDNVLAVKVDRTRYADSRWYTGGGIYRHVKLMTMDKLHIPLWGTFITTPKVSHLAAELDLRVTVKNAYTRAHALDLVTRIIDPEGHIVAATEGPLRVPAKQEQVLRQRFSVRAPKLWDIDHPHLYRAMTMIVLNGAIVDTVVTPFGIRSFHFDPEKGFFLNNRNRLVKGVCLHHDGGLVGAAVPAGVWRRRLRILKAGGCNAIRTAHNPPSEEFLNLCDELGFLVQDEFFDEWDHPKDKRKNMNEQSVDAITRAYPEHFQDWAERDLKSTLLRDRNHPSIFQWSIGNEIEWTYPRYKHATGYFDAQWSGNYFWTSPHIEPDEIKRRYNESTPGPYVCAQTAQKLAGWTRELDTTRPVTANCILPSASHVTGYADALDVVGYSYRRVVYDYARKHFPDKVVMGTENLSQWHEWKAVLERPAISGLFLWTGIDYMGEANNGWPSKGSGCGLLDTACFPKGSYHLYKTLWSEHPHIHLATQVLDKSLYRLNDRHVLVDKKNPEAWQQRLWKWHPMNRHWNYQEGQTVVVEVISNSDRVELFLNERSLGVKSLSDFPDRLYKWAVPFTPGRLKAVAAHGVQEQLVTVGPAAAIVLTPDTPTLAANFYDVVHVVAQLVDAQGHPVRTPERDIEFAIQGPVRSLGVDNGSLRTVKAFQSDQVTTAQGRCMTLLQAEGRPGPVRVQATSGTLQGSVIIQVIH